MFYKNIHEYIAYHSSEDEIDDFNFNEYRGKAGSSTRIDAIFFSDVPQKSWGDNIYKVKIISEYPVIYDLYKSYFDSMSIQEAFDALLRQETYYIKNDMENYNEDYEDYSDNQLWDIVTKWSEKLDLIIIKGEVYAKHKIEFIVPNPRYNSHSAKIINLGKI